MKKAISIPFAFFLSLSAFAAPPKIEVQVLPYAGADAATAATMTRFATLLSRMLDSDAEAVPVEPTLAANAVSCVDDPGYLWCVQRGPAHWNVRSVMPRPQSDVDARLVFIFDRPDEQDPYRGAAYIVPRGGKWISAGFNSTIRDGRITVVTPLLKNARQAGLDVPEGPLTVSLDVSALE